MADPEVVAVIQARTSSSRLPGKVLAPLGGRSVLGHVIARADEFAQQVVVCTSAGPEDDAVEEACAELDTICVRGPLDDVFGRFRLALADPRVRPTPWFARVTADCPLLSSTLARHLLAHTAPDLDLVAVRNEDVTRGLPVELVRRATFEAIDPAGLDGPQREHVTLGLYEDPGRYRVRYVEVPEAQHHPELRLTLDYPEDYELLRRLFDDDPDLTGEAAVARLLRDPELAAINRTQRQKPVR